MNKSVKNVCEYINFSFDCLIMNSYIVSCTRGHMFRYELFPVVYMQQVSFMSISSAGNYLHDLKKI